MCVSPSSKEQICLLCEEAVSNNDSWRKLTTSRGRKRTKTCFNLESIFHNQGILAIRTHLYTHFPYCNPQGVRKGLIKGEALRLPRTNSSAKFFCENIYSFNLIEKITSEFKFTERKSALQKNNEVRKKILPFVTTYHPALQNLKGAMSAGEHAL